MRRPPVPQASNFQGGVVTRARVVQAVTMTDRSARPRRFTHRARDPLLLCQASRISLPKGAIHPIIRSPR
jgi:hypothetical protein